MNETQDTSKIARDFGIYCLNCANIKGSQCEVYFECLETGRSLFTPISEDDKKFEDGGYFYISNKQQTLISDSLKEILDAVEVMKSVMLPNIYTDRIKSATDIIYDMLLDIANKACEEKAEREKVNG